MGRARAWLRLALMQKKLADYLKILIDHKDDLLSEYFEPDALMMSDEAIVIMGLLVGLNVIDCNLCVKVCELYCIKLCTVCFPPRNSSTCTQMQHRKGETSLQAYL